MHNQLLTRCINLRELSLTFHYAAERKSGQRDLFETIAIDGFLESFEVRSVLNLEKIERVALIAETYNKTTRFHMDLEEHIARMQGVKRLA